MSTATLHAAPLISPPLSSKDASSCALALLVEAAASHRELLHGQVHQLLADAYGRIGLVARDASLGRAERNFATLVRCRISSAIDGRRGIFRTKTSHAGDDAAATLNALPLDAARLVSRL